MDFILFILLNAVLFIRPAEIVPDLMNLPIYEVLILGCLAASHKAVLGQLTTPALVAQPITACVLGVLAAAVLSHATQLSFGEAVRSGVELGKVLVYYFLLVAVVNTPARLRRFLGWLVAFVGVLTVLALLQYHGAVEIPSLASMAQRQDEIDEVTGEPVVLLRLCSTGIFNNPNDLSRILVVGITLCVVALTEGSLSGRLVVLPLVGLFGYALSLTHSRGGFLALLGSLMGLFAVRFGRWKTVTLALVVVPALLLVFNGRTTRITTSEGTGRQRLELWSEGFAALREHPVFGIGMNRYEEMAGGLAAHNSFVHCYTELGLVGGTFFTGACGLGLWLLSRLGPHHLPRLDPELGRLRPCLTAILLGYMVGMLSSTRSYSIPTYLLLGLSSVYVRLATGHLPEPVLRFDTRLLGRLAAASAATVAAVYLYLRVSLH